MVNCRSNTFYLACAWIVTGVILVLLELQIPGTIMKYVGLVVMMFVIAIGYDLVIPTRFNAEEEAPNPEYLNFRPCQKALDRMRNPKKTIFYNKKSEAESLSKLVMMRADRYGYRSVGVTKQKEFQLSEREGLWLELAPTGEAKKKHFIKTTEELQRLDLKNLLKLTEADLESSTPWRAWQKPEEALVLAFDRPDFTREAVVDFLWTLRFFLVMDLPVETLPFWSLLRSSDGDIIIPRVSQHPDQAFGHDSKVEFEYSDFLGHTTEPDFSRNTTSYDSFQFALGTFVCRALCGTFPYDRVPLSERLGETVQRALLGTQTPLAVTLEKMTALSHVERYPSLDIALQTLLEALDEKLSPDCSSSLES